MKMSARLVPLALLVLLTSSCKEVDMTMLPPYDLTANEGFSNPIGFYDAEPVLSWKLPVADDIKSQSAYRIVVAS
ncbi:MAG: hypothetical protein PVF46_02415, partial [Lysobacterales bacterium]